MPEVHVCDECRTTLPPDAPQGLCPRCLLQVAFGAAQGNGVAAPIRPFTASEPAAIAHQFPQLEILELLSQGNRGAVYKARQVKLDRLVNLRILPPEIGRAPAFAERFNREAQALTRLNHPNLVSVYDFGEAGGQFYLVTEFVDGVTVRQLLQEGHLEHREALRIVPQLCAALEYAHDAGVVHGDLQPEDLLVDPSGTVKIADFGLARLLDPATAENGAATDQRQDSAALGGVFYEMLTGTPPEESTRPGANARIVTQMVQPTPTAPNCEPQQIVEIAVRDIGATLGILGGLLVIGFAIALTNATTPLWGLCLIIWLAGDFPWATRFKAVAGVVGMIGSLGLIAFAVWWTNSGAPLVAIILVIWFATDFPWPTRQEEAIQAGDTFGLSSEENRIRQVLAAFTEADYLAIIPEIPAEKLTAARKTAQVPPDERIFGLLDLTEDESASCNLVFGTRGIYFHNPAESSFPGPGSIRYEEFPSRTFVNHGTRIYLGSNQYLCPEESWSEYYPDGCETIARMLNAVVGR